MKNKIFLLMFVIIVGSLLFAVSVSSDWGWGKKIKCSKVTVKDSTWISPLNVTQRSTEPSNPISEDMYLDDGSNTNSGNPGWRRYTGHAWEDVTFDAASPGAIGGTTPAAGNFTALTGKRTEVGAADYNPSILTADYIIAMTNTAAARAVTISTEDEDSGSTSQPRIMIVKDESGGAAANNITVSLESGGNIDGAANYVIDQNYQSITLYIDGTNAWIY